ncbi:MAG: AAA family ATPase [Deltaproteobacteria bacterium]
MYESFYGFKEKPFDLHPDPDYLYMSRVHENTYTHLEYAILENKGFVVVTGEIGSGKTTLINYLLNKIGDDIQVGLVNNTNILPAEFLKMVCKEFELDPKTNDKAELIDIFSGYLIDQFAAGERVVLIIDEAQNLTNDTMEEIRMLSNIETEKHHLIQIILVGQPELKFKLQQGNLKQFVQRVTVHCHLKGLEKDEVAQYINHRLEVGGGHRMDLFDKKTVEAIALYSRGIPRLINVLCDSSLVYGFADELQTIGPDVLDAVYEELKSLGTFTDFDTKPTANPISPKAVAAVPLTPDPRIEILEGKIQLLGDQFRVLKEKLDFLTQKRIKRDDVMIELLRILRDNLDSRSQLVARLYRNDPDHAMSDDNDHTGDGQPDSPSNVSSLEKHLQKKS